MWTREGMLEQNRRVGSELMKNVPENRLTEGVGQLQPVHKIWPLPGPVSGAPLERSPAGLPVTGFLPQCRSGWL